MAVSQTLSRTLKYANTTEVQAGTESEKPISPAEQKNHNSACRAWVRFTTADDVIDTDYGVSSLTHGSTGITTVNFDTNMTDTEYAVVATPMAPSAGPCNVDTLAVGSCRLLNYNTSAANIDGLVGLAVFGDQ